MDAGRKVGQKFPCGYLRMGRVTHPPWVVGPTYPKEALDDADLKDVWAKAHVNLSRADCSR